MYESGEMYLETILILAEVDGFVVSFAVVIRRRLRGETPAPEA